MKTSIITASLLLALGLPSAHAASSASASLDWSDFEVIPLSGASSSTWTYWSAINSVSSLASSGVLGSVFTTNNSPASLSGLLSSGEIDLYFDKSILAAASANYGLAGSTTSSATSTSGINGFSTLGAGAIIEFSVPYLLTSSVTTAGVGNSANASTSFSATVFGGVGTTSWQQFASLSSLTVSSLSKSGYLDLLIKNTSASTITLLWSAQAVASASTTIAAAVPEPETYAMFLAGLGVMGAMARRRKQK